MTQSHRSEIYYQYASYVYSNKSTYLTISDDIQAEKNII